MDMNKIEKAARVFDTGSIPWSPTFTVGTCSATGKPKISCGLSAPDTRAEGMPVKTGVKAGGFNWPPHTVVLDSDDEHAVHTAQLEALDKAILHELRENVRVRGELFVDPHRMG